MRKTTLVITGIAFVILGILIFVARSSFRDIVLNVRLFEKSISQKVSNERDIQELRLENQSLKIKLVELENISKTTKKNGFFYEPTRVYSEYPWNNRSEIIINKGKDDGMAVGMPVVIAENILVGKIISVKRKQSSVQTIFDASWRSSVAIGTQRAKAVLKGGLSPVLEFVSVNATIEHGMNVVNSSPEFPLNVFLGTIDEIRKSDDGLWYEATIRYPITLETVDEVSVITNFP